MRIVVTGATGMIGSALCRKLLSEGHEITILSREPEKTHASFPQTSVFPWEAVSGPPCMEAVDGADAVVHLAGEPIAEGRWTAKRKGIIEKSRVKGTFNLVDTLLRCPNPPRTFVSSSAIGYYGSRDEQVLDETADSGDGFLAHICRRWEQEAWRVRERGIRVVFARTGLVLSTEGGAFPRILLPFEMFVGGPLGNGKQWMSWIHVCDEIGAIEYALMHDDVEGPLNLTAPNPVTNNEFSRELSLELGRPAIFRVPGFALKLLMGEMAENLLLSGQRVLPRKLEEGGYRFTYPELKGALENLCSR